MVDIRAGESFPREGSRAERCRARRAAGWALVGLLVCCPPAGAEADPIELTTTGEFEGRGRHPKSHDLGLLVDRPLGGPHILCFVYSVVTGKRIRGHLRVEAELLAAAGVIERIDYGRLRIERLPIEERTNFGEALACAEAVSDLEAGDRIGWKFRFERPPKLGGASGRYFLSGSIVPGLGLGPSQSAVDRARSLAGPLRHRTSREGN